MSSNETESRIHGEDNTEAASEPRVTDGFLEKDGTLSTGLDNGSELPSEEALAETELPKPDSLQEVTSNDIKSPPLDANVSVNAEKLSDHVNQSASPSPDDEWLDILGTGHLKKKVIRDGQENTRPTPGCWVVIRTKGTLEDSGKLVDVNDQVNFAVGEGDVLQAWDLVASLMCIEEVCLVKTTSRFAYGEFGRKPDVPSNASIVYELELLEVHEPIDIASLPEEQLLDLVDAKCNRGNVLFQRKEYLQAVSSYQKGSKFLQEYMEQSEVEDDFVMSSATKKMKIRCLNNLAATQLKTEAYNECFESCEKVLELDKDNVKALFRSGKVMLQKGESSSAVQYLRRAQELSPNEKVIKSELRDAVRLHEANKKKEKDLYKKMVQGLQNKPKSDKKDQFGQPHRWGTYAVAAAAVAVIGMGIFYFFQSHRQ